MIDWNISKFQKNQLTTPCLVLSTAELTVISSYQENGYNNDMKKNELISLFALLFL